MQDAYLTFTLRLPSGKWNCLGILCELVSQNWSFFVVNIAIRRAASADASIIATLNKTVQELHAEAQPERYKPYKHDNLDLIQSFESRLESANTIGFIAEDDKKPIGYILCVLREVPDNPYVYQMLDFHIDEMAVETANQGQGVGHLLLEQAFTAARELHTDAISLGVAAFNEHAIKFYQRHGFEIRSHQMWVKL